MKATARPGWDLGKAQYLDLGITLAWRVVDVGDRFGEGGNRITKKRTPWAKEKRRVKEKEKRK